MAKRIFGFFKGQTQNAGTQVALIDHDKLSLCLDQFFNNSKILNDLYSAFVSMLRCGKSNLRITEDMIETLGKEASNFDTIVDKLGVQIKRDEEELKARKCRVSQMKEENERLKQTLEKFRKDTDWHTWEEREFEQLRKINVTKLHELRKERLELEKRLYEVNTQVEDIVEDLHEASERLDSIQILRENQMQDHREEIQVLIKFWSETKTKRSKLLAVKQGEDSKQMIRFLAKEQTDLIHLEEDNESLKIKQDVLDAQIQDELEDQEEISSRNQDLLAKLIQNEEFLFTLKATKEGIASSVIAAKWHDHVAKRPRDWYKSIGTNENLRMLPDDDSKTKVLALKY